MLHFTTRMRIQKSFGSIVLVRCVTLPAGFIPFLNSVNRPKVKCEGPSGFKSVVSCFYTVAFCKHNEIILVQQQIKCVILWQLKIAKLFMSCDICLNSKILNSAKSLISRSVHIYEHPIRISNFHKDFFVYLLVEFKGVAKFF